MVDASATPDAYVNLSGPVFAPDHIVDVAITMKPADWDALRMQTRSFNSIIEGDWLAQPFPSPFSTFEAAVVVDGTSFVPRQEYLGLEKLTLNNSKQDPAFVRQCLTYQAFAAAGVVAPRCYFAHVRVNGADLGIFVNVETIDHHLTKKRYSDGTGTLYEGTLSDFRTDWRKTFDAKGGGDGSDLLPLINVLETATDADLLTALAPHIDLDRFMTYRAMEMLSNHWDGYANTSTSTMTRRRAGWTSFRGASTARCK